VVSNFFSSSLVRLWSLSNAAAAAADHQKLAPRRSFLPAHTCCCCGGEDVSISALLEAVATASGNNPGAVEKKKQQKQHQPLLVQELLRKWATKGNVLEREWGMDLQEREERWQREGRERGRGGRGRWCSAVQLGGAITSATYHTRQTDKAAVNALINTTSACLHAARTYLPAPYLPTHPPTYPPTYLPLQFYHSFLPPAHVGRSVTAD
jgi:hypothetical protein